MPHSVDIVDDNRSLVRFAIVLVNYNGLDDTRKCLYSLSRATLRDSCVIVVDNGSSPECATTIDIEFPWVKVIRSEVNRGWSGGNNLGIQEALSLGVSHVFLINNDTKVAPDILDKMASAFLNNPDYSIIGPVIFYMDEPDVVMTDGVIFNRQTVPGEFFTRQSISVSTIGGGDVWPVDIVNGCAICIDARVFESIGFIDDRFFLIHEESEFCLRSIEGGFKCGLLSLGLVWHKGSSSFKRTGSWLQRYYGSRNLMLLLSLRRNTTGCSRSFIGTWFNYYRHVWYIFSVEMEEGQRIPAEAAVAGMADGLLGRYGPRGFRGSVVNFISLKIFDFLYFIKRNFS